MFLNVFKFAIASTSSFVGIFIAIGLVLGQIEKWNNIFIQSVFGKIGVVITGFIGTTIHELSHYLMCLIFGHNVTDVKFFRPIAGTYDGVLGYVNHTYDTGSFYQQVGNFFIGIAPMIFGTFFIFLALRFMLPTSYLEFTTHNHLADLTSHSTIGIGKIFGTMIKDFALLLKSIFNFKNFAKPNFWIFVFIMYSISTHMTLSMADLKNSLSGIIIIFSFFIILGVVFSLLKLNTTVFYPFILKYNILMLTFLSLGLFFAIFTLGLSYLLVKINPF